MRRIRRVSHNSKVLELRLAHLEELLRQGQRLDTQLPDSRSRGIPTTDFRSETVTQHKDSLATSLPGPSAAGEEQREFFDTESDLHIPSLTAQAPSASNVWPDLAGEIENDIRFECLMGSSIYSENNRMIDQDTSKDSDNFFDFESSITASGNCVDDFRVEQLEPQTSPIHLGSAKSSPFISLGTQARKPAKYSRKSSILAPETVRITQCSILCFGH